MTNEYCEEDDRSVDGDEEFDADRYDTAGGWDPSDEVDNKYAKVAEKHRQNDTFIGPWNSMLEVRPATGWMAGRQKSTVTAPPELFGPLWNEGELAVMFAGTGVGKSILAVQIAESIARGINPLSSSPPNLGGVAASRRRGGSPEDWALSENSQLSTFNSQPKHRPKRVIYVDLEHTLEQFRGRYTVPSPVPGRLPVRYRFAPGRMMRAAITDFDEPPPGFKGDLEMYLLHSLPAAIEESRASIVIIDSLSSLVGGKSGAAAKLLRSFRISIMRNRVSILVVANARPRPAAAGRVKGSAELRPITLADIAGGREIAELADSVFAIGRSNYAEDIRYIKHLKSKTSPPADASNVTVLRLARTHGPSAVMSESSAGREKAVNAKQQTVTSSGSGSDPSIHNSSFDIRNSPTLSPVTVHPSPETAKPFLGFSFLGTTSESDHLRDYAAEFAAALDRAEKERLRAERERNRPKRIRSSKDILVNGILDGSYSRYLTGD